MRTAADEMRAPKYAHVERERRWLVQPNAKPETDATGCVLIEDRYIIGTRLRLRRMTDEATGARAHKLTRKYEAADPLARPIVTAYLDDAEYAVLTALPAHALTKRRFTIRSGDHDYNVDRFEGALAGLRLTEIEQEDDAALRALDAPHWAGHDVSHDPHYQGGTLALSGIPKE